MFLDFLDPYTSGRHYIEYHYTFDVINFFFALFLQFHYLPFFFLRVLQQLLRYKINHMGYKYTIEYSALRAIFLLYNEEARIIN